MASVVPEIVGVIGQGIGLATPPEKAIAPQNKFYSYEVTIREVKDKEVIKIEKQIDKLREVHKDKKVTPLTKKKLTAASLMTVGMITGIAMAALGAPVVGFVAVGAVIAVASLVIGVSTLVSYFSKYDLDNSKVRDEIRKTMPDKWTFEKISNTFSNEEIIGYDLFGDSVDSDEKAKFYASIVKIRIAKDNVDQRANEDYYQARREFSERTKEIEDWINKCRSMITTNRIISEVNRRDNTSQNEETVRLIARLTQEGLQIAAEKKYDDLMQPMRNWYSIEKQHIREAHHKGLDVIEENYNNIYSDPNSITVR